jgi:hypothetical protein
MPDEPLTTPEIPLTSKQEVYVRRAGTSYVDVKAPKWRYVEPVPAVVIGMIEDRVLVVVSDTKEVAIFDHNQVWTTRTATPHRLR